MQSSVKNILCLEEYSEKYYYELLQLAIATNTYVHI